TATAGAACGVVTASPVDDRVVFILGPDRPTAEWSYGPARRQGAIVHTATPGEWEPLDARDLVAPFTAGALRGGSHVHVFSPDGRLVSFTYEDALLPDAARPGTERNLRAVGVSVCGLPVTVPATHPRNHSGTAASVLVTALDDEPTPGSDRIVRACEEAWNARSSDPAAPVAFSSWRSKFEPPAPPPPEPLPRDDAEGMLRRLLESNDPAHVNTRYLLAVMLERKRILRPQPSVEKGFLVYEHARTGETFLIIDPALSLADLVAVQEEVSALLAGLSAPPPAPIDSESLPGDSEPSVEDSEGEAAVASAS
ncbi:MAG: DUF3748 domain-containing protein, partial [Proteobacteria bacterium]|nr:DUF3748 domain-containing protein [Pseudomonadota bacterium]